MRECQREPPLQSPPYKECHQQGQDRRVLAYAEASRVSRVVSVDRLI